MTRDARTLRTLVEVRPGVVIRLRRCAFCHAPAVATVKGVVVERRWRRSRGEDVEWWAEHRCTGLDPIRLPFPIRPDPEPSDDPPAAGEALALVLLILAAVAWLVVGYPQP